MIKKLEKIVDRMVLLMLIPAIISEFFLGNSTNVFIYGILFRLYVYVFFEKQEQKEETQ